MLKPTQFSRQMMATRALPAALVALVAAASSGCWGDVVREVFEDSSYSVDGPTEPGSVGDQCIPADESFATFSGFSLGEINISDEDPQCSSGNCMVVRFRGRVTCPEGNQDGGVCTTAAGEEVSVPVYPQLPDRPAERAVFCSCRCDGPAGQGPFCDCPSGMACEPALVASSDDSYADQYAGSYCVKP